MSNKRLHYVEKYTAIAAIVSILLGAITGVADVAVAGTPDSPDSPLAERDAPGVPPPTPDVLWVQVESCIELAMTTNKLNRILNYSPTQLCAYVDAPLDVDHYIGAGYTVIKDKDVAHKPEGFLTLPSKIVSGIEDPQVTFFSKKSSFSESYFADAWDQFRGTVDADYWAKNSRHLKRTQEGMAVNSLAARTLNQLHIHMSCVLPAVQAALAEAQIGRTWSSKPITLPPNAHSYYAIRVSDLIWSNPFLLMQSEPHFKASMPGDQTLVVTGAPGGFNVLLDYVTAQDKAAGEELLDQFCNQ
jgi:CDP-diacylglycerol pyrophosphatase